MVYDEGSPAATTAIIETLARGALDVSRLGIPGAWVFRRGIRLAPVLIIEKKVEEEEEEEEGGFWGT